MFKRSSSSDVKGCRMVKTNNLPAFHCFLEYDDKYSWYMRRNNHLNHLIWEKEWIKVDDEAHTICLKEQRSPLLPWRINHFISCLYFDYCWSSLEVCKMGDETKDTWEYELFVITEEPTRLWRVYVNVEKFRSSWLIPWYLMRGMKRRTEDFVGVSYISHLLHINSKNARKIYTSFPLNQWREMRR
jgi:hypothetical protein